VVEEADESMLWLELLDEAGVVKHELLNALHKEAKELTALFTASRNTARNYKLQIANHK